MILHMPWLLFPFGSVHSYADTSYTCTHMLCACLQLVARLKELAKQKVAAYLNPPPPEYINGTVEFFTRKRYFACDTEVAHIDVTKESPVCAA